MKKILLVLLVILFSASIPIQAKEEEDALTLLMTSVGNMDVNVEQWQVIIREKREKEETLPLLKEIKNRYQGSIFYEENIVKYKFVEVKNNIQLEIIFHFPRNNHEKPEVIAVLSGEVWDEESSKEYRSAEEWLQHTLFTEGRRMFSWMELQSDDIIYEVPFIEQWTNLFNLQHVTKHDDYTTEKTFTYGYTPHIKEAINIDNTPINLQLVTGKDETGLQKITIGTPILIHEY